MQISGGGSDVATEGLPGHKSHNSRYDILPRGNLALGNNFKWNVARNVPVGVGAQNCTRIERCHTALRVNATDFNRSKPLR